MWLSLSIKCYWGGLLCGLWTYGMRGLQEWRSAFTQAAQVQQEEVDAFDLLSCCSFVKALLKSPTATRSSEWHCPDCISWVSNSDRLEQRGNRTTHSNPSPFLAGVQSVCPAPPLTCRCSGQPALGSAPGGSRSAHTDLQAHT